MKAAKVWPSLAICVLSALMLEACAKPKSEGYRRVELFSAGHRQVEFMCLIGHHSLDTLVGTTPWQTELDLDTMNECICGTHFRVLRITPASDRLWVWGFDRDSLRLDKYLASPSDTVDFHMRSWICYQGRP